MKVKVYVIELPIPAFVKRWGVRLGIPAVSILAGGVAFAGLPGGYADGQPLSAEALTSNLNYLQSEITALNVPVLTNWVPYTPTVTHLSSSEGTTTGLWRRVGDSMELRIETTLTASITTSGGWIWSLPSSYAVDASKLTSNTDVVGHAMYYSASGGGAVSLMDVAYHPGSTAGIILQIGAGNWVVGNGQGYNDGDIFEFTATVPVVGWSYNQ